MSLIRACGLRALWLCALCALWSCGAEEDDGGGAAPMEEATCAGAMFQARPSPGCSAATCPAVECSCLSLLNVTDPAVGACISAEACLESVNCEVACKIPLLELASCRDQALGRPATCQSDAQCDDGMRCGAGGACEVVQTCDAQNPCQSGTCSNGVCELKMAGTTCSADEECASGICVTSVVSGGLRQVCSDGSPGSRCQDDDDCIDGFCVGQAGPNGIGVTRSCSGGSEGEPCNFDTHCDDGLTCQPDAENNNNQCR